MAQYDGSIRINTKIDSKNASAQLMSLENRITKTADKISALRSKMDALKNAKIPTDEYKSLETEASTLEKKLLSIYDKQERFLETGGKENTSAYKRMTFDAEQLEKKLKMVEADMQAIVDEGKDFTLGSNTEEYSKLGQQLTYLEGDYSTLIQRKNEFMQKNNVQTSGYERLNAAIVDLKNSTNKIIHPIESMKSSFSSAFSSIKEKAAGIAASIINGIAHPFQTVKKAAINTAGVIKKTFSGISSVMKKVGSSIKGIASKIFSIGKNSKSASGGISAMGAGFKDMLKKAISISSLFMLFKEMFSAVKEGLGNLAQYSQPVNDSLSSLKSSLTQLKNSLATAFAPILTAVAPALTSLINMLSKAATAVGMLFASLTGQKSFVKATAVQEGYAESLKKTSKGAKEANKQLSSLDKLNNLSSQDNNSDNSDGGGGTSPGDMFETVDIPSQIGNLADMIKHAWETADFTEIGSLIGMKLKNALEKIPWTDIQDTASKIGKSFATLINGFVEVDGLADTIGNTIAQTINTGLIGLNEFSKDLHWDSVGTFISDGINGALQNIDWETALSAAHYIGTGTATALNNALTPDVFSNVGTTIGNGINSALTFANSFLDTFDWDSFGSGVAVGLNKGISTIDWDLLGETIGDSLNAFFDTFGSFAETFDWAGFGEKTGQSLSKSIETFNWSGAGTSSAKFVNGLFVSVKSFIDNTDWRSLGEGITTSISSFLGNIDWGAVGGTISSFAIGILDFLTGLMEGIEWSEVPQAIIDGISDFFSEFDFIGTFSAVGEFVGTAIVSAIDLIKALKEQMIDIGNKIAQFFVQKFKEAGFDKDKGILENGKAIILGLFNGILDAIKGIGNWIKENIFNPFIDGFKKAFGIHSPSTVMAEQAKYIISGLLGGLKDNITSVIEWLKNIPTWFKEKFDEAREKAYEAFKGIGDWFGKRYEDVTKAFSKVGDWFGDKFENAKSKVHGAFSGIGGWFSDRYSDVKSSFSQVNSWFKDKFEDAYKNTKSPFSNAHTFFTDVWNGIKGSFGNIPEWFKTKFSDAWTKVKEVFSTGGKIFDGIKEGILSGLKEVINGIIEGINKVIKVPFDGLNTTLKNLRSVNIGGIKPFDWIPSINVPQIPKLATGTVVPPNKEFLAILGDNKREHEIVSPVSTIEQAVENVLKRNGSAGSERIVIEVPLIVDGRQLVKVVQEYDREHFESTGKPLFLY